MPLEEEMRHEVYRLEQEIAAIDIQLVKLHEKILQLLNIRKKKDHDLRVLKQNFGLEIEDKEIQTTLSRLLKEKI